MLVLSRKAGERIVIAGSIELLVVKAGGGRVKLAFSAPPHVTIRRAELGDRIERSAPTNLQTDWGLISGSGSDTPS